MASPAFYGDGSTSRRTDGELVVLQKILGATIDAGSGGGGGGTGGNSDGIVDPTVAPTSPTVTNYYTNTVAGTFWIWPANGAAWQQIV